MGKLSVQAPLNSRDFPAGLVFWRRCGLFCGEVVHLVRKYAQRCAGLRNNAACLSEGVCNFFCFLNDSFFFVDCWGLSSIHLLSGSPWCPVSTLDPVRAPGVPGGLSPRPHWSELQDTGHPQASDSGLGVSDVCRGQDRGLERWAWDIVLH